MAPTAWLSGLIGQLCWYCEQGGHGASDHRGVLSVRVQAYQVVQIHADARVALARHRLVVGVAGVRLVELVELDAATAVRGRVVVERVGLLLGHEQGISSETGAGVMLEQATGMPDKNSVRRSTDVLGSAFGSRSPWSM